MSKQPEQILEEKLVEQLQKLNYSFVKISNEKELIANLKSQLEKHNQKVLESTGLQEFTECEFERVLNILSKDRKSVV